jgi:hypothetical protein
LRPVLDKLIGFGYFLKKIMEMTTMIGTTIMEIRASLTFRYARAMN